MSSNTENMTGEEGWQHNGSEAYVVFLKVAQVPDDADPNKQRGCSQKEAAHVVTGQVLWKEVMEALKATRSRGQHRVTCTFACISIFRMDPIMDKRSLMMTSTYQPFRNSFWSSSHILRSWFSSKNLLNLWTHTRASQFFYTDWTDDL